MDHGKDLKDQDNNDGEKAEDTWGEEMTSGHCKGMCLVDIVACGNKIDVPRRNKIGSLVAVLQWSD